MNLSKIKIYCLFIPTILIIQCQAKPKEIIENENYTELSELIKNRAISNNSVSFVEAAAISTPCVVHIKTKIDVTLTYHNPFQGFFDFDFQPQHRTQRQESSGSGVIISNDGYIATNFHVIQNATEIEVTLRNKNTYKAKIIGHDKESDLALIKIEETNLPVMQIANSDSVLVGEWVLAVGNPFNLESTVTQGIVSAKGRSLNLGNQQDGINRIESFIQTDAAVNPGNSGGALVNLSGELIGINTAIASPTGAYAGYAFAVPSNLVNKVIEDLKKYGTVQRAFLGIKAKQLTSEIAKKMSLPSPNGVLVHEVIKSSAAEAAGLKTDDIILKIDNNSVSAFPELLEQISIYRPGDKIKLSYIRKGNLETTEVVLKNRLNTTEIIKEDANQINKLGIKLQSLSAQEKAQYRVQAGVKIIKIEDGIISRTTEMKPGFIILQVNNREVKSEQEINDILNSKTDPTVVVEGFYPNRPYTFQYAFKL